METKTASKFTFAGLGAILLPWLDQAYQTITQNPAILGSHSALIISGLGLVLAAFGHKKATE